jgi:hypothetical protein
MSAAARLEEASRDVSRPSTGRHEFKYLVRSDACDEIAAFLSPHLELDKYSQGRPKDAYTVRSIYYDSPRFTCYYEKANGEKNRRKCRVRTHNQDESTAVFLECKQRRGGTYTKEKARLTPNELASLRDCRGLDASAAEPASVLGQLLLCTDRWDYQPTSLVVYDRTAYVYPGQHETIRVTFDRNPRCCLFPSLDDLRREDDLVLLLYGWTILEVKFNDVVPRFLAQLVTRFSLERQACSKYAVGVSFLLDENPSKEEGWNHVYVR